MPSQTEPQSQPEPSSGPKLGESSSGFEEKSGVSGFTEPGSLGYTIGMVNPKHYRPVLVSEGKEYQIGNSIQGEELEQYKSILNEFSDVFAWDYSDLKGVSPELCQHKIDLLEGTYPIRQRQYRLNPKYSLLVKDEIDKLLEAGFIYPVLSSEWVSPIHVVQRKLRPGQDLKIRMVIDYRRLNQSTRKDHFPLPYIDHWPKGRDITGT